MAAPATDPLPACHLVRRVTAAVTAVARGMPGVARVAVLCRTARVAMRRVMAVAVLRLRVMGVPMAVTAVPRARVPGARLALIVARIPGLRSSGIAGGIAGVALGASLIAPALVQAAVRVTLLVEVHAIVRTGLVDRISNGLDRHHARDRRTREHEPGEHW